jgi:hypothetical protein
MKTKFINQLPVLFILLFALVFAKLHINKRTDKGKDVCFNICGDARGYYAWLPAVFIYHDLNFAFFDSVEMKDTTCGGQSGISVQDYRYYFNGKACDKYYPGTAFMMLPFFAAAHIYTMYFSGYLPNGYTFWYFKLMAFSAMFYYMIGMLFFLKVLKKLGLNTQQQSLAVVLVTFGSNMIYYIIDAPLYSHIYSFTLAAAFLNYAFALKENFSLKNLAWLAFISGMIFVTRPVNLTIMLLLPFILGSDIKIIRNRIAQKPSYILYLFPVFVMPAILFSLYKISTGHYFIYSYAKEGFDFLHPHFWQFMFHYDNGVFLYMPLLLAPFLFLFLWYKPENKSLVAGTAITLLITMYIHSSWWCWNYSFSFGARTMLDFVPLFGIIIALSLKQTNLRKHFYVLPVYFLCCGLTLILYHQKSAGHFMNEYPITDYWKALGNAFGLN